MRSSITQGVPATKTPLSPRKATTERQPTFTFGMSNSLRTPSRDRAQVSKFAKLWQERSQRRRGFNCTELQNRSTFKMVVRKVMSALKVVKAFLSFSSTSKSQGHFASFRFFQDAFDMNANNVSEEVRLEDDGAKSPLFDPAWFKANREIRLSSETKAILCQDPNTRTREQVQTVFRSLQTLCSFGEYPLYHQKAMCQNATYQSYPKNATIIQQGHRAENFYFILSGSAKSISKHPVNGVGEQASESVSVMKRGMSFGEAEIMNDTLRTVTVTSKTPIELLVISKEDYAKIFFGAMSETGRKNYIAFLRTVEFLKDWPVDMLESQPEHSQHCYFKRGCVIVQNSNNSPWLYIIKSGVCEVLIQLKSVKPRKAVGRNVRELTSLEALTKITLERRQEMRKREKDKKEQRQKTLEKRQRRITLCHECT